MCKIKVVSLNYLLEATKVYNFEVENSHCYFVGEEGFLVLNICDKLLNDILKKIPNKLLKGSRVDASLFTKSVRGSSDKIASNGWKISRDVGGVRSHGGSYWKLNDPKGNRIATLDKFGNILRK